MKAVPHPDKGGANAPLALPPARERPTIRTLSHLYDLLIDVEKRRAAGPWDAWDEAVLDEWRAVVRTKILDCESDLREQLDPGIFRSPLIPDYVIVDRP